MADLFKAGLSYFFPGDCYETVWERYEFFDSKCLKMFASRFLSTLIVLGAMIVKVPQILKIWRAGSVEGLSYLSVIAELAAVTFTSTYNIGKGFPFSSWGESFFLAIQSLIILTMMFYCNNHKLYMVIFAPVYGVGIWYLTSDLASIELLKSLQASVLPLMILSKSIQIYTTYSNGTTGQLSLITSYLNWVGTAVRIFTTMQETQDSITLLIFCVSFALNTIVMIQFVIYWNAGSVKQKKEQ